MHSSDRFGARRGRLKHHAPFVKGRWVECAAPMPRISRITFGIALLVAVGGLAFLVYGVTARPYTEIEAQLVFQVARIQHHLPLYTDPTVGAWEEGAPPSRFNVLYPPAWVELLALFPTHSLVATRTLGRAISVALLLFSLGSIVAGAKEENRPAVAIGALLTLGLHMIVRGAGLATTDVPAITLSIAGLVRANRKGGLDVTSAVLLAMAPFVKHAVVGVSIGAFVAHLVTGRQGTRRAFLAPLGAAAVTAAMFLGFYHWLSGGPWLQHILRATGQSLSFDRWVQEFVVRIVPLGAPHLVVLVVAIRRRTPFIAVFPFAASLLWTIATLAKHGSTTHYWLEPSLACLVTLGALPAPERVWAGWRSLALALSGFIAITSLPELARAPKAYAEWDPVVASVRRACSLAPGQIAMAADVRLETEINGRVIIPTWESSLMARSGRFPVEVWRQDLLRAEVGCIVTESVYFEGSANPNDIVTVYRQELRDSLQHEFIPTVTLGPFLVWQRRHPEPITQRVR